MQREVRRSSIPHVSALDGARGAAVAGVLLFHGGHLTGGYLGVDFFFTLSGFLITSLLLAETARTGGVGLGGFWARRARRLLPALAVLMIGIAVYSRLIATPQELGQIRGDALATLAYAANWRSVFAHQSYFALFSAPSPLQHTWSLAIEEQFYVIWPLVFVALIAIFKRATPKAVLVTALALAAGSSVLTFVLYSANDTNRDYYGTDTRAAAILLGVGLAAWLAMRGPTRSRHARIAIEVLGIAGISMLVLAWTRLDGQSPRLYRGGFLVCGLAATAIIAAAVHPDHGPIARVLSWKPLCLLGLISYGVYLYHWPLDIVLNEQRVGLRGWPLFAVQSLVTIAIAIASYRLIEQPIRHGAFTPTQSRAFVPVGAVLLVLTLVLTTTLGAKSFPVGPKLRAELNRATSAYEHSPHGSTRVMIVGNSVAFWLAKDGFHAIADHQQPKLTVLDASVPGCHFPPQLRGVVLTTPAGRPYPSPPCDPTWEADVVQRLRPQIVFWITADASGNGGRYRGQQIRPCSESYDSLFAKALKTEIRILSANGARVVIPTEAYNRYYGFDGAIFDTSTDCENHVRRTVAAANGAQVIELGEYTCPDHVCPGKVNGVTLRADGLHYEGDGAKAVAGWLMSQVDKR